MKQDLNNPAPGGLAEVLKVAAPLLISMGSFTLMQFCNRMFLAWYSEASLQAAIPAGILSFTFICFFMELTSYGTTFVAQYHGANELARCARATGQSFLLALISWPVMLALMPLGLWFITTSRHPPEAVRLETIYFTVLMIGSAGPCLGAALGTFFSGRGDTVTTMRANILANILNIILDYILIFGKLGFPALGIKGAAIATVISGFSAPLILASNFLLPEYRKVFNIGEVFRLDKDLMKRILRFGSPSAANMVLDMASFAIFVMIIGKFGETTLTASNIALSVNSIVFMPLLGLGSAAGILVGKYQGMRKSSIADRSARMALRIAMAYMSFMAFTYILVPEFYISFFTMWGEGTIVISDILPSSRMFLILMAMWGMFDVASIVLAGALRGAGDTKFVMIFFLIVAWGLWVPGQFLLLGPLGMGAMAQWVWLAIYIILLSVGYVGRFLSGRWRDIEVIESAKPPLSTDTVTAESPAVVP